MEKLLEITNPLLSSTGLIFIIMGLIMYKFPPKKINSLYGYRTGSSMENQKKWDFAQKYSAKIMAFLGIIFILISFIRTLLPLNNDQHAIFGCLILIVGIIFMIVIVEKRLKKI